MQQSAANPAIKHLFVLMLENRSFDHILGFSGIGGTDSGTGQKRNLNGVSAVNTNTWNNQIYPATSGADNVMPFDPGHEFDDAVEQLCGHGIMYKGGDYPAVNNSGFVSDYATTSSKGQGGPTNNFGEIMKCYDTEKQLPVMYTLASEFAICDNWFASLPGPTWPNRFFAHAASSNGLDHSPRGLETTDWETLQGYNFKNGNIFQLLDANSSGNNGWRIYRGAATPAIGSIPAVAALKGIHLWDTHPYKNFAADVKGNYPFSYTFIEPNYGDIVNNSYSGGQSQHPMDDVRNGERLIKSTYEAIRQSPLWNSSMLIITYDEHGGFYDHVSPGKAIAPGDSVPHSKYNSSGFTFKQYGVRVPALVISPYTPKNIISGLTYDHSSIPATIEALFRLPSLTDRDAGANNLTALTSLAVARTDAPDSLPDVLAASVEELALVKRTEAPPKKDSDPVDGGNLPSFLHIVMKDQLEREGPGEQKNMLTAHFSTNIKTRGDARAFLEERLGVMFTKEPAKPSAK